MAEICCATESMTGSKRASASSSMATEHLPARRLAVSAGPGALRKQSAGNCQADEVADTGGHGHAASVRARVSPQKRSLETALAAARELRSADMSRV